MDRVEAYSSLPPILATITLKQKLVFNEAKERTSENWCGKGRITEERKQQLFGGFFRNVVCTWC